MQSLQQLPRVGPIAGVVLGELYAEDDVLGPGQAAVEKVFPERHAALHGVPAQDPRGQHAGIQAEPSMATMAGMSRGVYW